MCASAARSTIFMRIGSRKESWTGKSPSSRDMHNYLFASETPFSVKLPTRSLAHSRTSNARFATTNAHPRVRARPSPRSRDEPNSSLIFSTATIFNVVLPFFRESPVYRTGMPLRLRFHRENRGQGGKLSWRRRVDVQRDVAVSRARVLRFSSSLLCSLFRTRGEQRPKLSGKSEQDESDREGGTGKTTHTGSGRLISDAGNEA